MESGKGSIAEDETGEIEVLDRLSAVETGIELVGVGISNKECGITKEPSELKGEKAFCSGECRDKHIRSDDYKEKCASGALKPPLDYSVSPCSGPLVFFAGVAAA
ncbi:FCS-Like Zinc finger 14-like [Corylus avellana]|uniref:FCS-Like Zinc finger 14-like n=1 Tax=Corylus avellana TaxID=13451 RepID=UPI00286D32AF|nr:FCS-Like Zinc finger 14-like [Corylus avellana]